MRVGVNVTPSIGSNIVASIGSRRAQTLDRAAGVVRVLADALQGTRCGSAVSSVLRLARTQALEHRRHLQQRVLAHPRHRRMAGHAVRRDREAEHALLGAAHAIEAPAAVFEELAAALVDEQVAADLLRVRLGDPFRPKRAARLLVDDRRDQQLAARRAPARARQRRRRRDLGRHLRLHVECAPAPEEAVDRHLPTTGRASTPPPWPGPCRRGPGSTASAHRPQARPPPARRPGAAARSGSAAPARRRAAHSESPPRRGARRGTPAPRARCPAG